ncbi:MAG TPA: PPC domain-containing protein, partial [Gemmatales bacterium]|nr:PPC domain-containing protein [Gemmatales bacterium]
MRWFSLLLTLILPSLSLAASPFLGVITPRGGQRGTEVEFHFHGARLKDVQEILCYTPGFTVGKIDVVNDNVIKTKIQIAADARLGQHCFRVRTASGVSDLKTIFVGALPEITEKEPNNDFKAPQPISLNVTVNGTIENEDVDYFSVECKKGQRLSVEIEGMRLANQTVFDPAIAILNSKRFEIATSDDSAFAAQDGVMSVIIPEDGVYTIMVRETSYGGNGECRYRLHVGTFPRPVACMPAGGKPGEEIEITFLGDASGPIKQKVQLPATMEPNFGLFVQDEGGISPSPLPFRLSPLSNFVESEPSEFSKPNVVDVNTQAINGTISKPGENDFYRFKASKGQVFDVHCYGR